MRSDLVVVVGTPVFDEKAGLGQRAKPVLVEAVIAEGAVEALDEGILHGFTRLDVMKGDPGALSPEVKGFAGKLGTVIDGDSLGQLAGESQALQDGNDRCPADRGVDMDGQALSGEVIDEGKTAEAAAGGELVVDEIHRPALIGFLGCRERHAGHCRQLPTTFAPQGKSFLSIDTFGALVIDDQTFGLEDIVQDGSAPARFESRPVAQPLAQGRVVTALRPVLQGRTVPAGQSAEAAGGEPKARDDFGHDSASRFGL